MRTIYTNVEGLSVPNVEFRNIKCLDIWLSIQQRRQELEQTATKPERVASACLEKASIVFVRQAYFRVRKRSYYLDFFIPSMMLAIEIDGSSHDERKEYDRRRDSDFRSIGIRTIRIKNKVVMEGRLFEVVRRRLNK